MMKSSLMFMPYSCHPQKAGAPQGTSSSLVASFSQFALSGGFCFLLSIGLLYLFTDILHFHYLLSTLLGTLITNGVGFILNRHFAFRERAISFWRELGRYYIVNLGSLLLNLVLMAVCVSGLGISYLVASAVVAIVMMVFNFLLHRFWSFGSR